MIKTKMMAADVIGLSYTGFFKWLIFMTPFILELINYMYVYGMGVSELRKPENILANTHNIIWRLPCSCYVLALYSLFKTYHSEFNLILH